MLLYTGLERMHPTVPCALQGGNRSSSVGMRRTLQPFSAFDGAAPGVS